MVLFIAEKFLVISQPVKYQPFVKKYLDENQNILAFHHCGT